MSIEKEFFFRYFLKKILSLQQSVASFPIPFHYSCKIFFSRLQYINMVQLEGTVLSGSNNVFEIECDDSDDDGNHILRSCSFKSKRLKLSTKFYNPLAPGDRVQIEVEEASDKKGQILSLVPRTNAFIRWNVKGRAPQLLAANLDYIILVTTPAEPEFRPRFIDRELVQAEYQNLKPIIVVNKYDLPEAQDPDFQNRLSIWEEIGYKVLRISAKTGEGLQEFAELLTGKLSALVGQSGIGKSSLINVLDNTCVLKTGSLSQKYGKGCHTTTKGTLMHIHLNESIMGGVQNAYASIIDTPGVRRFVLNDIEADNLALYFREFEPLVGKCKFGTNCRHEMEPGCKILEAVQSGVISEERFESWQRIRQEIKTGSWED